jgi:hypothetical protein
VSQRQMQAALGRIYLSQGVRESLRRGDVSVVDDLRLSGDDQQHLVHFVRSSKAGLELFADLLGAKRAAAARALMPLSVWAVGHDTWDDAWATHVSSQRAEGATISAGEGAMQMAPILLDRLAEVEIACPPKYDVVAYERCKLRISAGPPPCLKSHQHLVGQVTRQACPLVHLPFLVERFQHDVTRSMEFLRAGLDPSSLECEQVLLLFYRDWRHGAVGVAKVSPAVVKLLERCDGASTIARIATSLTDARRNHGFDRAPDECEQALANLAQSGVIVLINYKTPEEEDSKNED